MCFKQYLFHFHEEFPRSLFWNAICPDCTQSAIWRQRCDGGFNILPQHKLVKAYALTSCHLPNRIPASVETALISMKTSHLITGSLKATRSAEEALDNLITRSTLMTHTPGGGVRGILSLAEGWYRLACIWHRTFSGRLLRAWPHQCISTHRA